MKGTPRYFEYYSNWQEIRARTFRRLERCTLCFTNSAEEVHYLYYQKSIIPWIIDWFLFRGFKRTIAGRETPGWSIVPLCKECHGGKTRHFGSVHHNEHWVSFPNQFRNYQRFGMRWRLRIQFWLFSLWWLWGMGLFLGGVGALLWLS